ncbi:MAG: DnaJ domain-containing protein, partial [Desulfobacterales bacterium]|nr:DnaJ domain-containing protein [Desulfobacterales bacterium]
MKIDISRILQFFSPSRRATPGQVKTAYRHLARQWHPDRCAQTGETPGNAALKMREINLAR